MRRNRLYVAYFLALAAILILTALGQRTPRDAISLESGWEYVWSGADVSSVMPPDGEESAAWHAIPFPSNPPDRDGRALVWFRKGLPDRSFHDARLFIYSIDTAATFYVDGREIYSWNAWRPGSEPAFAGWPWHAVPLPADSAGKELYVSVYSDYRDIGLWGRLFVSSAPTLYGSIVTRDSPHFVIVIMSLTMMTATVVGIGFTDNRRLVALFLTLLGVVIVAAVASTLTRQFVVDNPVLWFLVSTNVYLAAVALCFLVLSELIRGTFRHILAGSA